MKATATANANIALVKYWGKRDAALNLPARGSFSVTLAGLTTTTTVALGGATDALVLGGELAGAEVLDKALRVVNVVRAAVGSTDRVQITSANDFPTGAGLASSASGLAALAVATAGAFGWDADLQTLSRVARIGSGSASRSLFGGYVEWLAGERSDGLDSFARPVFPADHWDLRVFVAVVSPGKKAVGSTSGMTHTKDTSPFHEPFLATVDADIAAAKRAVQDRDFAGLGRVAERSSLRMHAAMQGADPALVYLGSDSWTVIGLVRDLQRQGVPVFLTADAGPNIKVFYLPEAHDPVRAALLDCPAIRRLVAARPGPGAQRVA